MGPAKRFLTSPRTRCRSRGVLELRGGLESRVTPEKCACFGKQRSRGNPLAPPLFRWCEMQHHVKPGQKETEKTDACVDTTSGDWQLSVSGLIWRSPSFPAPAPNWKRTALVRYADELISRISVSAYIL